MELELNLEILTAATVADMMWNTLKHLEPPISSEAQLRKW